ncbi:MAG: cobalt ECF transporter T component CbiQ [Oligoflexia bacterium]|nr:cobalt ECF transporter T component CbiQ [Oligoflexia bacterium]
MLLINELSYSNHWRFIHPAEKIIFVTLCMLSSLIAKSPYPPLIVAIFITIVAAIFAKIKLKLWVKLLIIPLGFVLLGCLSIIITFSWPSAISNILQIQFSLSSVGIVTATHVLAKFFGCTTSLLLLTLTTPLTDIIQFLRAIKIPAILLELLVLCYRAIFIILDTSMHIHQAQVSRLGYNGITSSFRSCALLIVGILTKSIKRSHSSWMCILSRAYNDEIRLLSFEHKLSTSNLILSIILGLIFMILSLTFLPASKSIGV